MATRIAITPGQHPSMVRPLRLILCSFRRAGIAVRDAPRRKARAVHPGLGHYPDMYSISQYATAGSPSHLDRQSLPHMFFSLSRPWYSNAPRPRAAERPAVQPKSSVSRQRTRTKTHLSLIDRLRQVSDIIQGDPRYDSAADLHGAVWLVEMPQALVRARSGVSFGWRLS